MNDINTVTIQLVNNMRKSKNFFSVINFILGGYTNLPL